MDLEQLNDAGMSFLVGAYVIVCVEAIARYLFNRHVTGYIDEHLSGSANETTAPLTTGVVIALSFAIGLLVEDACYGIRDHFLDAPFRLTYSILDHTRSGGDVKTAIQRETLIEDLRPVSPALTSLGDDLCQIGYLKVLKRDGPAVHAWACEKKPLPAPRPGQARYDAVDYVIRASFYFAKNRVYMVDNYFAELQRFERRLQFSRTLATISLLAVVVTAVLLSIRLIQRKVTKQGLAAVARGGGVLLFLFIAAYFVAYIAYMQESHEHASRVFGYYHAMIRAPLVKPAPLP